MSGWMMMELWWCAGVRMDDNETAVVCRCKDDDDGVMVVYRCKDGS